MKRFKLTTTRQRLFTITILTLRLAWFFGWQNKRSAYVFKSANLLCFWILLFLLSHSAVKNRTLLYLRRSFFLITWKQFSCFIYWLWGDKESLWDVRFLRESTFNNEALHWPRLAKVDCHRNVVERESIMCKMSFDNIEPGKMFTSIDLS